MNDPDRQDMTSRLAPARLIPTPLTVSPELRRSIAAAAAAPVLDFSRSPRTAEQWRAYAAASNAVSLKRVSAIREAFPVQMLERQIAGVTVREIRPSSLDPANIGRVLIHLHGGGYVLSGGEAGVGEGILGAHYARMRVISVDYRMPPDHPFPAAIEDALAVWNEVSTEYAPAAIGVIGTSAGGGLLLALGLSLKASGANLPGALAVGTPWADLAGESDSYAVNAGVDSILVQYPGLVEGMARVYAGSASLSDPLVSPVHGDFSGFPPTVLTTGTRDILLSDTVRVYRAMRSVGVEARLEVYEAMSHAEYNYAFTSPESANVFGDIAAFFDRHLAR